MVVPECANVTPHLGRMELIGACEEGDEEKVEFANEERGEQVAEC